MPANCNPTDAYATAEINFSCLLTKMKLKKKPISGINIKS
jgi:hypothetical protein